MTTTKPDYVYVTYIATTPEKLWQALVDPKVMQAYWFGTKADSLAHVNISDWTPGSSWEHQRVDNGVADVVGKVIEHSPTKRLAFTWSRPADVDDESKHSRVTFEIEPQGARGVRLTVIHDGLKADPKMLDSISGGWPQILSHLKTLLETGAPFPRA